MVNPIRKAIEEETWQFVRKHSHSEMSQTFNHSVIEFMDALEHNLNKSIKMVTDEERRIVHENAETKAEFKYSRQLNDTQNLLTRAEKRINDLEERNKRLHEDVVKREKKQKVSYKEIQRLRERLDTFESKVYEPLVVYKDKQTKVDFFKDPLIKHLEEEIAFLRTLVTQNIMNK